MLSALCGVHPSALTPSKPDSLDGVPFSNPDKIKWIIENLLPSLQFNVMRDFCSLEQFVAMKALIIKMLQLDPTCRPTAAEILLPRSFSCSTCATSGMRHTESTFLNPGYLQRTSEDVPAVTVTYLKEESHHTSASHTHPGAESGIPGVQLLIPLGRAEIHDQTSRLYRASQTTVSSTRSSSNERDIPDLTLSPSIGTVSSATVPSPDDADFLHEIAIGKPHDNFRHSASTVSDSVGEDDASGDVSSTASPQTSQEHDLTGLTELQLDGPWNPLLLARGQVGMSEYITHLSFEDRVAMLEAAEEPNVDGFFAFNRLEPILIMPLSKQKRPTWPPRFME
jgi:serine/threonine protein kinase